MVVNWEGKHYNLVDFNKTVSARGPLTRPIADKKPGGESQYLFGREKTNLEKKIV